VKRDIPCSGTGSYYNIEEFEEKQRMESKFDITFTATELNAVLGALGKLPFGQIALLIQNIQQQVQAQKDLQSDVPMDGDFEEVKD